jgi:NAD(P)-dependent dehydrogenase (short-subunit alcohol dehydrogenase family)
MANVVITGANRGIGLELTRQYAGAGDRVYAFARAPAKADALNELAASSDGRVTVVAMDVGDAQSIIAGARDIGDTPVDILINNAGIMGGREQSLDNIDFDNWIEAFTVMTIGPFRVAQAFLKNLEAAKNPKIMTVTSQLGASTWPYGGTYIYSSAKAGVNRVMQILALDLKSKNIIVGLIHPGWVKTDMGSEQADIMPSESASGIRNVIASLSIADSGKFYKWNGEIHPW